MTQELWWVLFLTALPISELRGGIPLGIALGLNPALVCSLAVVVNALVFLPVFFGMEMLYNRFLHKIPLFDRYLARVRRRGEPVVKRFGYWGLVICVAIPLPLTGVYTGTFLAWVLGMEWRKAFPRVALGALIAGIIVSVIALNTL